MNATVALLMAFMAAHSVDAYVAADGAAVMALNEVHSIETGRWSEDWKRIDSLEQARNWMGY